MPRNWNTRAAESARPEVGHDAQPFPHPPTQPGRLNLVFDQRTDAHHFIAQLPVLSFQLKAAPGTQHDIIIEEGHEIRGDPAQSEVSLTGESTQLTHDSEIEQVPVSHAEAIVGAEGAFRLAVRACIHDDHARRHVQIATVTPRVNRSPLAGAAGSWSPFVPNRSQVLTRSRSTASPNVGCALDGRATSPITSLRSANSGFSISPIRVGVQSHFPATAHPREAQSPGT